MPVITVFSGVYCKTDSVVKEVLESVGYKLVGDADLAAEAASLSGIAKSKIEKAYSGQTSVFNKFTHEKERAVAWLRMATAKKLAGADNLLLSGFCAILPPKDISHVLRVCLIADARHRLALAQAEEGFKEKDAVKCIQRLDEEKKTWAQALTGEKDPWNPSLYDIVIPMDKTEPDQAAALIARHLGDGALAVTEASKKAVKDFLLAATVETVLADKGHDVAVSSKDGHIVLTINRKVLLLERLENELKSIVSKVDGVASVETKVGKEYYQTDIYRRADFEIPSKVLLVDDEREFVQTLSERLSMRDMGSHVVYDGESALDMVERDEPEVMVLDLKMPGIDGIEVLRQVKKTRPDVEVIILTGHGSEKDREVCMELGAFAYLHKPVDIDQLSETLKKANEKVRAKK
jgi:two-component system, OmpR family, response regulator CpxR